MGICIVTECIWVVLNPFLSGSGNSSRNLEILKGALGLLQRSKDPMRDPHQHFCGHPQRFLSPCQWPLRSRSKTLSTTSDLTVKWPLKSLQNLFRSPWNVFGALPSLSYSKTSWRTSGASLKIPVLWIKRMCVRVCVHLPPALLLY